MSFDRDLKRAEQKVLRKLNRIKVLGAVGLFNNIIVQSPVDKGRFRSNWNASIGTADYSTTSSNGGSENVAQKFVGSDIKDILYLTNNLPYAQALEDGHSDQRPKGWVRTSGANAQRFVDAAMRKVKL